MLFGKTHCRPLAAGFKPPVETIVKVDALGNACVVSVTPADLASVSPVMDIETDLKTLQQAGINPQEVVVSGLMRPSNPSTLQEIAEDKLSRIATDFKESSKVINSNSDTNE